MIRYEYEDEDEEVQRAMNTSSPRLDLLDTDEFGDIDEFFADPNFQALVNETPWLQSIANEFYEVTQNFARESPAVKRIYLSTHSGLRSRRGRGERILGVQNKF